MKNIEKNFESYIQDVESFVQKQTKQYDRYLHADNMDKKECFFREIFYVVKNFLQEENSNKLFIKIPVHELGIKLKEQEENWNMFQKTISEVLCLATADKQKQMVKSPDLDSSAIGSFVYCHNDNPIYFKEPQFFEIDQKKETVRPYIPK